MNISQWHIGPNITGDSEEDTALLRAMYERAVQYITSFSWSPPINTVRFAFGVGGVVALFLVEFNQPISGNDDKLWVVVGDVPSAYFVVDDAYDAASALRIYCELMSAWADAVSRGHSTGDVFPVDAAPTKANADQLRVRIAFIEDDIIPGL